jgi:curved DNA-binding protein
MKYKDYYALLGVAKDADLEQIKKAYRKLARMHHPDMSKAADAEAKFKDIAQAYATLKNTEKRAAYDQLGSRPAGEEFAPPPHWQGAQDGSGHFGHFGDFADMDLSDLFASMGQGRGQRGKPQPVKGRDFESTVRISLEDAHKGTKLNLDVPDADGTRTLEVSIPAGTRAGQKLRLRGKGGKGQNGGLDGDIYLHISLLVHPQFRADHHNLYFDLMLTPWEAALGCEVQVDTLDGVLMLTVPQGTRAGHKLRMRGRGLADDPVGASHRGDLFAVVQIDVPSTLSARERELFQELSRESHFSARDASTNTKEKKK